MRLTLDMVEADGFVVATLGGIRTPEALMEAAAKVTAFCAGCAVDRVLADIRGMSGALDTLETYDVAGHRIPVQRGVHRLVRTAVLDHTKNLERIRFFETVTTNRGINLRVFDDEETAVHWLRSAGDGDAS